MSSSPSPSDEETTLSRDQGKCVLFTHISLQIAMFFSDVYVLGKCKEKGHELGEKKRATSSSKPGIESHQLLVCTCNYCH